MSLKTTGDSQLTTYDLYLAPMNFFSCPRPQRMFCLFQIERSDAVERFAVTLKNSEPTGAKPLKKQIINVKAPILALNSSP